MRLGATDDQKGEESLSWKQNAGGRKAPLSCLEIELRVQVRGAARLQDEHCLLMTKK